MDILQAVQVLRPGTSWNLRGDSLEQVNDGSPRVTPPTAKEIQAVIDAIAYQDLRRQAYPLISDQLDAIMKGGQALIDMQAQCMAVKAKFPKPS